MEIHEGMGWFTVPVAELVEVEGLVGPSASRDERSALGHIHLEVVEGRRVWTASDGYTALQYVGGPHDGPPIDGALLSPRLFPAGSLWKAMMPWTDEHHPDVGPVTRMRVPTMRDDGSLTGPAEVMVAGVRLAQPCGIGRFPDLDGMLAEWRAHADGWAEVEVDPYDLQFAGPSGPRVASHRDADR